MEPTPTTLRMYGAPSDAAAIPWSWADARLRDASFYWVGAAGGGPPHLRPVWGVWAGEHLHLSVGTPAVRQALAPGVELVAHLDDAMQVVIVEGTFAGHCADPEVVAAYDAKYDWSYDVERYGAFVSLAPARVLAWRATGPDGRDGFTGAGRWTFDPA